ncbi:hypothetical protein U1Q18_017298, partial [Sarracenia purpurea var. burkii]
MDPRFLWEAIDKEVRRRGSNSSEESNPELLSTWISCSPASPGWSRDQGIGIPRLC